MLIFVTFPAWAPEMAPKRQKASPRNLKVFKNMPKWYPRILKTIPKAPRNLKKNDAQGTLNPYGRHDGRLARSAVRYINTIYILPQGETPSSALSRRAPGGPGGLGHKKGNTS